jgi:hypothetical protein
VFSLSYRPNYFEQLPDVLVGHILGQLNTVTGSQEVVNEADIPVIMRYISNLACTSKKMAFKVNHPYTTHVFLKSLSDKYGQSREHFAALLNTVGTRRWMWENIKEKGDDQVYQVIQDIYELAADASKEAKNAGLVFEYSKGWPAPLLYYRQTKQGFVLYTNYSPSHMVTPFGEVRLYGNGISHGNSALSVSELFIRRLKAAFTGIVEGESRMKGTNYVITASGSDTIREISPEEKKQISEEELKNKVGTQDLIVNNVAGNHSTYNIREVKGKKVPDVVLHESRQSQRGHEIIGMIWEMLEANRLGLDPIAKKIEQVRVPAVIKEPFLKNILEVCQWAIELLIKLEQQQLICSRETWSSRKTKLLTLECYNDARALEVLNDAAKKFLNKGSEWIVQTFGCVNDHRSLNGKDLGSGVELWIYEERTPCGINELKIAYDSVIKSISQNWIKSELKDHPGILYTESEEDYILFVKKENTLDKENLLIRCLANLLGLSKSVSCGNDWKDKSLSGMYLWIKKDGLEKTLKVLNISL